MPVFFVAKLDPIKRRAGPSHSRDAAPPRPSRSLVPPDSGSPLRSARRDRSSVADAKTPA